MDFKSYIKEVPNFPKEGIYFKDIQPLLQDSEAFYDAIYEMGQLIDMEKVDYFVGMNQEDLYSQQH